MITPYVPRTVKGVVRRLLPGWLLQMRNAYKERYYSQRYRNLTTKEVFTNIYKDYAWGRSLSRRRPFSGTGSHEPRIVDPYIGGVTRVFASVGSNLTAVDLGCGDFYVGSKISPLFSKYIACDIVESVVEFNRSHYDASNLEFITLDMARDELPDGDVAIVRQVFQHLSNDEILSALEKIRIKYRYLLVTEHLPTVKTFTPNLDIPTGPGVRLALGSGVVLSKSPFNLKSEKETCVSEVANRGTVIRTMLYTNLQ